MIILLLIIIILTTLFWAGAFKLASMSDEDIEQARRDNQ